mgnify:CR=1 FL=1
MKKIIIYCLLLLGIICSEKVVGQSLSSELDAMNLYLTVNGSFNASLIKSKKLSFSVASKFVSDYSIDKVKIWMLTNVGYAITPNFKTTAGAVYSDSFGIKPTIGFQGTIHSGGLMIMLFPNFTIVEQPEINGITDKSRFIIRMQTIGMANSKEHFFNAFRVRIGLIKGRYQFGLASDLNLSGNEFKFSKSIGLFLQYQIL